MVIFAALPIIDGVQYLAFAAHVSLKETQTSEPAHDNTLFWAGSDVWHSRRTFR